MIDDLSKTLRAILTQKGLPAPLDSAQIVFDHPSEKFNPQQTTVDLFLYDIREDLNLRSNEPVIERKNGEVITHRPPLRVACSYLVTAWPVGGADLALQEQRLLSQVLQVCSSLPTIPDAFLQGTLKGQKPPLPMVTALVDPQKNLSEFWTALGSQLRPSLTLTATFAMEVATPETAKMVTTGIVRFAPPSETGDVQRLRSETSKEEMDKVAEKGEEFTRIGGQVTDAAKAPVRKATVTLVELGRKAETDDDGRFILDEVRPGDFTLRVKTATAQQDTAIKVPADKAASFDVQLNL